MTTKDTDAPGPAPVVETPAAPRRIPWRRLALGTGLLVGLGTLTGGSWWWSCGWRGCPSADALRAWQPSVGGAVRAHDGRLVGTLSVVRRVPVPSAQLPRVLTQAVIAVEDRRFREHDGVDWRGVGRAAWVNLRALRVREGASTITMQLARLIFLGGGARDESFARKLLEVRYAGLLEAALDKDAILAHYLNSVYLGDGAHGVEAASRTYFGHGVAEVTLSEAAVLAGLAQAPSLYSPRAHPDRAARRRDVVLARMVGAGMVPPSVARRVAGTPVRVAEGASRALPGTSASWAAEAAHALVDSLRRAGALPTWASDDAITVHTTIDARAQRAAERAVARGAARLDGRNTQWAHPPVQGALVALDPATGAIRAMVGGRRVERGAFDRARRARRPVGSAFKPFVYAAAVADTITPATLVADTPVELTVGETIWQPTNFGDEYAGPITVRDAVARSANAATVRVAQAVGIDDVRRVAQRAGITAPLPSVPALALGAAALTPLELTAAYAVFANGGQRVTPHLVVRIDDAFGRPLWTAPARAPRPALDPRDAFLVQSMLRSVVDEGTARAVRHAGVRGPVAGKTGTTNDATDVWFVGFTPTLVAGLWFGADTPAPLAEGASGGRDVAPVWADFLRTGWHSPERDSAWRAPAGLERRRIDIATGRLADDWCGESRLEWFKTGTAPTASCREASDVEWVTTDRVPEPPEAPEAPEAPDAPAAPRARSPRAANDDFDGRWLEALPEVLSGERLPTREEIARAARDLDRLRERIARAEARARREMEQARREAERDANRSKRPLQRLTLE